MSQSDQYPPPSGFNHYEDDQLRARLNQVAEKITRPALQQLKSSVSQSVSVAQIYQLQTETAVELEEESLDALHHAQAEAAKRQPPAPAGNTTTPAPTSENSRPAPQTAPGDKTYDPHTETAPAAVNAPKPVARVRVSDVLSRVHSGVYLESQAEVDAFMDELRKELERSLSAGQRVQVR